MSEVDPDPHEAGRSQLGGQAVPDDGDPTRGGKDGAIGEASTVAADEPDDGNTYPVGGGDVAEEHDAPAGPTGPDA